MARVRSVIVIADHAHVNGGQAKVAIESAKGLAEQGLNVTFFAACGPVDDTLKPAGVRVQCLNQTDILAEPNRLAAAARGLWNRTAAVALRDLIAEFDPASSILHCHGFAKALSPAVGPVITDGPLSHVFTMHEYFLACPNGGFYNYQTNTICHRKPLEFACLATNCDARNRAHKVWRVGRQAILWSLGSMPRGLRDVICISVTQKRVMAPHLNPRTRVHYVPNPVSTCRTPRVRVEDNDCFTFIGRLNPEKGGLLFARAAREAGVKAVFVGDGPERDAIHAANPDAVITGWVGSREVNEWLARTRCLVFPSLWYETFGLVAFEAFAHGVPVICGTWNAFAEVVENQKTGLLVSDRSVASWAEAITAAKARAIQMSAACHQVYWMKWTRDARHIDILNSVYDDILTRERLQHKSRTATSRSRC